MKKSTNVFMLLILLFTLSSCNTNNTDPSKFNPKDYGISTEMSIGSIEGSTAEVSITITDEENALSYAYLSVLDENGKLVTSIEIDVSGNEKFVAGTYKLNYLVQNETYNIIVNGYLYKDGVILSSHLSSQYMKTGVWKVMTPTAKEFGLVVDENKVNFDIVVSSHDFKVKKATVKIYYNDILMDSYESDLFFSENYDIVQQNYVLNALEFDQLYLDRTFNVFVEILYLDYDYETSEYNLITDTIYVTSFKTPKDTASE